MESLQYILMLRAVKDFEFFLSFSNPFKKLVIETSQLYFMQISWLTSFYMMGNLLPFINHFELPQKNLEKKLFLLWLIFCCYRIILNVLWLFYSRFLWELLMNSMNLKHVLTLFSQFEKSKDVPRNCELLHSLISTSGFCKFWHLWLQLLQ